MEVRMLLWMYVISASFSAVTLLRRKGAADRRALFTVMLVGAVSALGVLAPATEQASFWAGTIGFSLFMLAPGLLIRLGRWFARGGAFHRAELSLRTAVALFPAAGFRAERDLYRALDERGGIEHPAAAQVRARIAALSGGPMIRTAPATLALCVVILVAFAITEIVGDSESVLTLLEFGANHAPLVFAGEVHRLMTAIFLHGGWLHLIFNVSALWVLGRWVEPELGPARTLVILLLSGLLGNVVSLAVYRNADVVAVGASGAALGLMGAVVLLLLRPGGHPMRARRLPVVLLIIGATLFMGFVVPQIDNGAHIGGLLTGALLGFLFTRVSPLPAKLMRSMAALLLAVAAVSMVLVGRDLPRWRQRTTLDLRDFSLEHAAAAEVRVNEKCFELSWHLIGQLSIELVELPADPAAWLADRTRALAGQPPHDNGRLNAPRPGRWAVVDGKEGRFELYLIEDAPGGRAALLSFILPANDPIIRERWVEPVISSFRFR